MADELSLPEENELLVKVTPQRFLHVCELHALGMTKAEALAAVGMAEKTWSRRRRADYNLRRQWHKAHLEYLQTEAEGMIEMVDEFPVYDAADAAKLNAKLKVRMWVFERILKEYRSKQELNHAGALSLIVETGVPRGASSADADLTLEDLI